MLTCVTKPVVCIVVMLDVVVLTVCVEKALGAPPVRAAAAAALPAARCARTFAAAAAAVGDRRRPVFDAEAQCSVRTRRFSVTITPSLTALRRELPAIFDSSDQVPFTRLPVKTTFLFPSLRLAVFAAFGIFGSSRSR